MATVVSGTTIKTNDGKTINAQNGGWYDGQQFWNGKLGAANVVINPEQTAGYGKQVSNEVIAQTDPGNVDYIRSLSSPSQVTKTLNDFQSGFFSGIDGPGTRVQTPGEIAQDLRDSGLLPPGQAPTAPNLVDTYNQLTEARGIDAIQASITEFKAQQDAIAGQLRTNKIAEQGKPVAKNVIQGRMSEQETQAQEEYDFVGRQLARKQDELNSALSNVQMIMQFTQQDYSNASESYARQFDQAISTINLVRGIQQDQKDEIQRATDNARANLQIMYNSITEGSISIDNLDPASLAQLNKLEVQAGLPVGFTQSLRVDPKANIIFTNTDNGITQVGVRNPDGSVSVQSYGTSTKSGPTSGLTSTQQRSYTTNAIKILNTVDEQYRTYKDGTKKLEDKADFGGDKRLSSSEADLALQQIIDSVGGDRALGEQIFIEAFKGGNFVAWGS
jgi:hypothetical protein